MERAVFIFSNFKAVPGHWEFGDAALPFALYEGFRLSGWVGFAQKFKQLFGCRKAGAARRAGN